MTRGFRVETNLNDASLLVNGSLGKMNVRGSSDKE